MADLDLKSQISKQFLLPRLIMDVLTGPKKIYGVFMVSLFLLLYLQGR